MKVIINADDLGKSEEVNEAIFDMMTRGSVTSATIMANGPRLQGALKRVAQFPGCSFGVHLNADEFVPLSDPEPLANILDESGAFIPKRIRQVKVNRYLLAALTTEFSRQIERLLSSGVRLSHIDSHHHVHTIPALFPALKWIQYRYRIRKVRIARNIASPTMTGSRTAGWQKSLYNFMLRRLYRTTTVTGFTDLTTFTEAFRVYERSPDTVELMVHPDAQTGTRESKILEVIAKEGLPWPGKLINYLQL